MSLRDYFEGARGRGILATADGSGAVDVAVYSRPHFIDEENVAFIMLDRLTHKNLQTNPHAAYLFMEEGEKYVGKRLFLTKTKEEDNPDLIETMRRKKSYAVPGDEEAKKRFLVYFRITRVLPLIGE